jgi:hypothetical protein
MDLHAGNGFIKITMKTIISNHHHFNNDHFLYSLNNIIKLIL